MRRKSPEPLTPAEWNIMKIVWELGDGTSRGVHEIAGKRHDWAPSTVKTILNNLVNKGFLKAKLDGNRYIYTPTKPAIKTLTEAADAFMDKAVDGVQGQLLCYMAEKTNLSQEDVDALQSLLDKHREKERRKK